MGNINSFAENIKKLVTSTNNQINILNGIQESIVSDKSSVDIEMQDFEGNTTNLSIPSLNSISKKADAVAASVNALMKGGGVVSVGDGTARTMKMSTIATVPERIVGLTSPTAFEIDANWWFEDMMYPAAYVSIDLVGKIDDDADRVKVNRVILDKTKWEDFYHSSGIENSTISYDDLITVLTENGVTYTEDNEILQLPLSNISLYGKFLVKDVTFVDGLQWYTLDSLQYKVVEENSDNQYVSSTKTLKIGDKVCVDNYLYEVKDLNEESMMVLLVCKVGYSNPQSGEYLSIYNEPWKEKLVNIKFSNNEINIIYIKGINENYNIAANEWSEPIMFISNDLVYKSNTQTVFSDFYASNIVDWGKEMIDAVKERKISAVQGITPNTPYLNTSDFSVVQINTQVNAALDSEEIISLRKQIETTKSQLSSLKGTIDAQQTKKQTITDSTEFNNLTKTINQNITTYKQLQTSYQSSLSTMQNLLQENNGVEISPKYHVRGFFGIPSSVYNNGVAQQIIGFEIQYRYIKEDATGVNLKSYTYTDQSGAEHTGIFSDWNILKSEILEKVWSSTANKFVWSIPSISDGTAININQIDLPITKGEKLEFKVRSISEAGYPYSPLKSPWSNSVIVDFPSNLMTSSDIQNIITDINDENVVNTINSELSSQGLSTHIDDSQANVNSLTNTYFKHQAKNIAYEYTDPSTNTVTTISLQDALDMLFAKLR